MKKLKPLNYIGYGVGDLGLATSYQIISIYFLFYLTNHIGIEPHIAGIIILVGKIWDAVTDPFMGLFADNYSSKKKIMLFGIIPNGIFFFLLWQIIPVDVVIYKIIYSTIIFSLFSTAYTIIKVPYASLIPAVTDSYDERTKLTASRILFSLIGPILGGLFGFLVDKFHSTGDNYHFVILIYTMFFIITAIIPVFSVKEKKLPVRDVKKKVKISELISILKIRPYIILLIMFFISTIGTMTIVGSLQYFMKYVLGDIGLIFPVLFFTLAALIAIPLWLFLSRKIEKKYLLFFSMVIAVIFLNVAAYMNSIYLFFVFVFLTGFFTATYFIFPYSLVPDIVTYNQWKYGKSQENSFFGFWTFAEKSGAAISAFIIGILLKLFGYNSIAESQSERVVFVIRFLFGTVSSLFILSGVVLILFYPITRDYYNKILSDLKKGS